MEGGKGTGNPTQSRGHWQSLNPGQRRQPRALQNEQRGTMDWQSLGVKARLLGDSQQALPTFSIVSDFYSLGQAQALDFSSF